MNLSVPAKYLAALLVFSAKKDIRYYLNGICLEVDLEGYTLIATDGHRIAAYRCTEPNDFAASVIIPNELAKLVGKVGDVEITIDTPNIELAVKGVSHRGAIIDGKYPEWRQAFPHDTSGETAQFNANYLGDLAKCGKELGAKWSHAIAHNGSGAALIYFEDAFVVALMPMRIDSMTTSSPLWARSTKAATRQESDELIDA